MSEAIQLVVFSLDELRYALHLFTVERIIASVAATSLPKAPDIVLGVINVHGNILPLLNLRKRFNLPEKEMDLSDQIIIAHISRRTVALVVDEVLSVIDISPQEMITAEEIVPGMEYIEGVTKLKDGMILIHDLDKFLSLEEEEMLEKAQRDKGTDAQRF